VVLGEPLDHLARALEIFGTEREDLGRRATPFVEEMPQLTQLSGAGSSPVAAVHHEDHVPAAVLRELMDDALVVLEPEVGRHVPGFDAVQVEGRKVQAIRGSQTRRLEQGQ
jgi:hypothetical protein